MLRHTDNFNNVQLDIHVLELSKNCYIFLPIIARLGVTAYTHTFQCTCRIHFKVLQKSLKTWYVYCALRIKTTLSHQCHTWSPAFADFKTLLTQFQILRTVKEH